MLREIWVIMLGLAFIMFGVSVVLLFVWKVPDLLDELSGRKAKRQVKMMHELNSSTGTFDNLSTSEIYMTFPSGVLASEEVGNIFESIVGVDGSKEYSSLGNHEVEKPPSENDWGIDEEGVPTGVMESTSDVYEEEVPTTVLDDSEAPTTYVGEEDEDATSLLEIPTDELKLDEDDTNVIHIRIIEEQSSL